LSEDTSKDLEQAKPGGELAELSEAEQALVAGVKEQIDPSTLVLPAIKLTHSLTQEVQDGDVEAGTYINSLTKQVYGTDVPFVVCGLYKGRFYSDDTGTYVARGDVAPDSWPEEYANKPFADIPDAEERWKADSNAGEHPWGSGAALPHALVRSGGEQAQDARVLVARALGSRFQAAREARHQQTPAAVLRLRHRHRRCHRARGPAEGCRNRDSLPAGAGCRRNSGGRRDRGAG
jgi:hypothetical protein